MSALLVIFGREMPDQPIDWRLLDGAGKAVRGGEGTLDTLSDVRASEIALVLPGYLVSAIETTLPARSERQALAAAPFAVEEELAVDPDEQHFALVPAPRGPSQVERTVLTVDRGLLSSWVDALASLRIPLRAVMPDYLCLPADADRINAIGLKDRLVLRHGHWGIAIDSDMAGAVAPAVIAARDGDPSLRLLAGGNHGLSAVEGAPERGDDPMSLLAEGARTGGPGLLQGGFAVRRSSADGGLSAHLFKWPAILATAATLVVAANSLVQGLMLRAETNALQQQTRALLAETFPDAGQRGTIRTQLRQINQAGEGGRPDFLVLSGFVAQGLDAVDAVSVQSVRFDNQASELNASILFDSYDALSRFRTSVESAGGRVEEGGSRQVDDRRAGDVKVTLP